MRIKPTDQTYSVSEIPFDSPAPSDKKLNNDLSQILHTESQPGGNKNIPIDESMAIVSDKDLLQINQQAAALDLSSQTIPPKQSNQINATTTVQNTQEHQEEETISAIQHYNQNISTTQDHIRVDNSLIRHHGDDDIDHESARDFEQDSQQLENNQQEQSSCAHSQQNILNDSQVNHYNTVTNGIVAQFQQIRQGRQGGRIGYKGGQLKIVYKTKKDKYVQDGNEMLVAQKEFKQQQEKIEVLQRRILALQRQELKSKKKIEEVKTQEVQQVNHYKTLEEIKQQRQQIQEKKNLDIIQKKQRVSEIRKKQNESKEKQKFDKEVIKIQKKNEIVQSQIEIDQQLREKQIQMRMDKEKKIQEIKEQKQKAQQKRMKQEIQFLGRIQHQYHKEKDQKLKLKQDCDEVIAHLENEESRLIEQLKNTQLIEKELKARKFKGSQSQYLQSPTSKANTSGISLNSYNFGKIPIDKKKIHNTNKSMRNSIGGQKTENNFYMNKKKKFSYFSLDENTMIKGNEESKIIKTEIEEIKEQQEQSQLQDSSSSQMMVFNLNNALLSRFAKSKTRDQKPDDPNAKSPKRGLMVRYSHPVNQSMSIEEESNSSQQHPFSNLKEQILKTQKIEEIKEVPQQNFKKLPTEVSPPKQQTNNYINFTSPQPPNKASAGINVYQKSKTNLINKKTANQTDVISQKSNNEHDLRSLQANPPKKTYNVSRSPTKISSQNNTKQKQDILSSSTAYQSEQQTHTRHSEKIPASELKAAVQKIQSSKAFGNSNQPRNSEKILNQSSASSHKQLPFVHSITGIRQQTFKEYNKLQLKSPQLNKSLSPNKPMSKSQSQSNLNKNQAATNYSDQNIQKEKIDFKRRRSGSRSLNNSMEVTVQDKVRQQRLEDANNVYSSGYSHQQ